MGDTEDVEVLDEVGDGDDVGQVLLALKKRRRRNGARFVLGLLLIVVPGGIWAATSTDPIRGFGNDQFFPAEPFLEGNFDFDDAPAEEIFINEAPTTTGPPAPPEVP